MSQIKTEEEETLCLTMRRQEEAEIAGSADKIRNAGMSRGREEEGGGRRKGGGRDREERRETTRDGRGADRKG